MSSTVDDDGSGSAQKRHKTNTDPSKIIIKFINKDGQTFYCTVKRNTIFRKIFETYRQHHQLQEGEVAFVYQDRKILHNLTPDDIDLPDGSEIDVMSHSDGGGRNNLF